MGTSQATGVSRRSDNTNGLSCSSACCLYFGGPRDAATCDDSHSTACSSLPRHARLPTMEASTLILVSAMLTCTIQMVPALLQPTAHINNSRIIGKTVFFAGIPVHQYLGVPFAEPPLGKLLFQKPKPIESYPTEFRAVSNPPPCKQDVYPLFPFIPRRFANNSLDCLYLNIWAPVGASQFNKKAVMYWMYGGRFRFGAIDLLVYDGTRLAALGDIIVVTVNYRLGYYGFFTSNTPDAPGNAGVWDVLEGLRWVNKYIPAFGGDSSRITIAGQDAGAIDVGLLSISPLSKGLYARQIMESGSAAYRRADNNTQNIMFSQQIAKTLGCADDSFTIYNNPQRVVSCVKVPTLKYPETLAIYEDALAPRSGFHLLPQFGDEILTENPRVSVINNNFRCTDLLIGSNKDEGSYSLTAFGYNGYFGSYGEKNPHVNRSFGESIIRKAAALFPDPEAIVDYYLPPTLQNDTDYRIRHQVYTALGDTDLLCPTVYYAEKCAEQKKNVYYYYFTHRPSNSPWAPWMGTTQFDEVPFVFGQPIFNTTYQLSEYVLSKQIIYIWSNFVKYGKPGIPWPLYSKENRVLKKIGPDYVTGANIRNGPHTANCEFLKPQFGF